MLSKSIREFTLTEFTRDYRAVMQEIVDDKYLYITSRAKVGSKKRYIFRVSIWNEEVDGNLGDVCEISSRDFKDATAFYLHISRDLMLPMKIATRTSKVYLLEPRTAAVQLVAERLGITVNQYERFVSRGGLYDLASRRFAKFRNRLRKRATDAQLTMEEKSAQHLEELLKIRENHQNDLEQKLRLIRVTADERNSIRNMLREKEAECRIYVETLLASGVPIPSLRGQPPLWPLQK